MTMVEALSRSALMTVCAPPSKCPKLLRELWTRTGSSFERPSARSASEICCCLTCIGGPTKNHPHPTLPPPFSKLLRSLDWDPGVAGEGKTSAPDARQRVEDDDDQRANNGGEEEAAPVH